MRNFLVFVLLLVSINAFSQLDKNAVDSLLNIVATTKVDTTKVKCLLKLEYAYRFVDYKIGLDYAAKAVKLSETIKWDRGLALAYHGMGNNYLDRGEHPSALKMYNKSLGYSQKYPKVRLSSMMNISNIYLRESNLPLSLEYIEKALKIAEDIKDEKEIAFCYYQIGLINRNLEKPEVAKMYYEKSLKIFREKNNPFQVAELTTFMGEMTEDYKARLDLLLESKSIWDSIAPEYQSAINNSIMLAKTYLDICESDSLMKVSGIEKSNVELLNETEELLEKAVTHSKLSDMKQYLMDAYGALAVLNAIRKNYAKAYSYLDTYTMMKDSIFSQENKNKIAALESEKEIRARDNQIKINKLTIENKEKQKWFLILGLVLLTVIGALLYIQSTNRRKTNETLKALNIDLDKSNKTKTMLLGILNHDLRSPVNSFIHYSQLQKENPEMLDENAKIRIEEATQSAAKNLLSSMEDILIWTKNQMENFEPKFKKVNINSTFSDIKNHFSDNQKINIVIDNSDGVEIFTDSDFLKTILRNFTANAINALELIENPTITWKAFQTNQNKFITITDNGLGNNVDVFKPLFEDDYKSSIKSGLGLHLVRDLAKEINCKIEVESIINMGTKISLSFKAA